MRTTAEMFSISDKVLGEGDLTENLKRVRAHGFTHIHFSQGWTASEPVTGEEADRWRSALEESGVAVLDVHGCHPPGLNLWDEDPAARQTALRLMEHRLRLTKDLGGDAVVYHVPTRCEPEPAVIERFIDSLARLEEKARALGLVIALENHYVPDNDRVALSACFERFDPDYIGFTFDSGHAIRSGNLDWLLQNCMERLTVLHLHDNEPERDRHWLPWHPRGHVDWERVARAIARSPYRKPLQFEVQWKPDDEPDHEQFLRRAQAAALRLDHLVFRERAPS